MPWTAPKASSTARGYDTAHKHERKRWQHVVDAGMAFCAQDICIMPDRWIPPGSEWHLGHNDARTAYIGAVHPLCNVRDGARRGRQRQDSQRTPRTSRHW